MKTYVTEEELKNVASGSCWTSISEYEEAVVVTSGNPCGCNPSEWEDRGKSDEDEPIYVIWYDLSGEGQCGRCVHLKFKEDGLGYCTARIRKK